jgi:hypothetical protein
VRKERLGAATAVSSDAFALEKVVHGRLVGDGGLWASRPWKGGKARKADWRGWSKTQEERFTLHLHDAGKRSGPLRPLSSYGLDGDGGGRSYDVPEG